MATANNNMIVGIDTINARVKVMTVPGSSYSQASVEYYPFERKLMDKGDYVSILESVFSSFDTTMLSMSLISLVLPNNLVGFDFVGVPTMSRKKMMDAVEVEFKALYKNHESLQMIPTPIVSSKKNALYILLVVNKAMLNGMTQIFTDKKAQVRVKTFESNAIVNAVLQLRPKMRRSNFILVDIKEDNTVLAVVNKERTVGYQNLPYGYNILSRTEVNNEQLLINHDVAELAVINATEIARKKKLTRDAAEAEELEEEARQAEAEKAAAEEAARQAEEAEREEQSGQDSQAGNEGQSEQPDSEASAQTQEKTAEELEAERLQKEIDAEFADYNDQPKEEVKKATVKVFTKKVPKALPMFMQRPIPETEEGFIAENFRIFEKRILLLKKHCDLDAIMPTPEFVLINMPKEYEFMIDLLNGDEDNGIEFRYFDPQSEEPPVVSENLDLVGALYAGTWNRQNNM